MCHTDKNISDMCPSGHVALRINLAMIRVHFNTCHIPQMYGHVSEFTNFSVTRFEIPICFAVQNLLWHVWKFTRVTPYQFCRDTCLFGHVTYCTKFVVTQAHTDRCYSVQERLLTRVQFSHTAQKFVDALVEFDTCMAVEFLFHTCQYSQLSHCKSFMWWMFTGAALYNL